MTSQTFLMTSFVTSFDCKFKRVFDQTEHCKTFFLLALNLEELYCEFSRLKVKKLCCQLKSGVVDTGGARGRIRRTSLLSFLKCTISQNYLKDKM